MSALCSVFTMNKRDGSEAEGKVFDPALALPSLLCLH